MPGVIASVAVQAGQPVHAGDLILTIEAMKMETGLYADKRGHGDGAARRSPAPRSTPRTCWSSSLGSAEPAETARVHRQLW